jgi:polar amino acid transport system substrate-binding protein
MSNLFKNLILISFLFCSTVSMAKQVLKVGVGNFPPFFIEDGKKGIFIEIIDEIFKQLPQYKVTYIFMSNNRILHEINYGESIDVACNVFPRSNINAYLSEPVFRFRDVAVSKKSNQLVVKTISDLRGNSIAAYQGAIELLGDEFKRMAQDNPEYSEHSHPKDTTQLMLAGKKDIRIGDINIFWYDLNNKHYNKYKNLAHSNFTVHYLWPDIYSHMAFKDQSLQKAVDEVIKELTLNGVMEKIYIKHKMQ